MSITRAYTPVYANMTIRKFNNRGMLNNYIYYNKLSTLKEKQGKYGLYMLNLTTAFELWEVTLLPAETKVFNFGPRVAIDKANFDLLTFFYPKPYPRVIIPYTKLAIFGVFTPKHRRCTYGYAWNAQMGAYMFCRTQVFKTELELNYYVAEHAIFNEEGYSHLVFNEEVIANLNQQVNSEKCAESIFNGPQVF